MQEILWLFLYNVNSVKILIKFSFKNQIIFSIKCQEEIGVASKTTKKHAQGLLVTEGTELKVVVLLIIKSLVLKTFKTSRKA